MNAVRVVAAGRVQGVGYRAFAQRAARERGLVGWVRNRSDGTVEAVLAGPDAAIADTLAALRRGPTFARVDDLRVEPAEPPSGSDVEIRPTA